MLFSKRPATTAPGEVVLPAPQPPTVPPAVSAPVVGSLRETVVEARKLPDMPSTEPKPIVLSAGVLIRGHISSPGPLHFQGVVEGTVEAPQVSVGQDGAIVGILRSDKLSLEGRIEGDIAAREISVGRAAQIKGRLQCETMTLAVGAVINGDVLVEPQP